MGPSSGYDLENLRTTSLKGEVSTIFLFLTLNSKKKRKVQRLRFSFHPPFSNSK